MSAEHTSEPHQSGAYELFNKISLEGLVQIGTTTSRLDTIATIYTIIGNRLLHDPRNEELEDAKVAVFKRREEILRQSLRDVAITQYMMEHYSEGDSNLGAEEEARIALFKNSEDSEP